MTGGSAASSGSSGSDSSWKQPQTSFVPSAAGRAAKPPVPRNSMSGIARVVRASRSEWPRPRETMTTSPEPSSIGATPSTSSQQPPSATTWNE